ncbi:YbjN domain-containing protein [Deinococcus lacus]|uniref:YbjN domain-containing protein n=1 Tax=Deinococcus lacus TaxID=392561 RepID=A0ABW1YDS4_9DEIO
MNPEFLTEEQVTPESLSEILQRAYIKHEIDEDGDLTITLDGTHSLLSIEANRKLLKYRLSFSVGPGTEEEYNAYANRLNERYIFAGFHVARGGVVGEYYLPYEGGVMPYHIVFCLRKMHSLVPDVVTAGDEDGLLDRSEETHLDA